MPLISESYHNEKLKKYNINIKTKYIVGNKILEKILMVVLMMIFQMELDVKRITI